MEFTAENWINNQTINDQSEVIVFCFPWAGAGAYSYYKILPKEHQSTISYYPIQLPGRENVFDHPCYEDIQKLCNDFINVIGDSLHKKKFAMFGHSMGGVLAYMIVKKLVEERNIIPEHLFISGCDAPSNWGSRKKVEPEHLLSQSGMDEPVLMNEELLSIYKEILHADIKLLESVENNQQFHQLPVPTTLMYGVDDQLVDVKSCNLWEDYCQVHSIHLYDGGHMYVLDQDNDIFNDVHNQLLK